MTAAPVDEDAVALESVQPAVVTYWRLSAGISSAVVFFAFAAYGVPALLFAREIGIVVLATGGALSSFRMLWKIVTSRLRYNRLGFSANDELLRLRYGVLFRTEKIIPTRRMQHVDIDHGPLERWFGLVSLSVFTAGGRRATFSLPGLSPERAEALRAQLLTSARRQDAGGPLSQASAS